ncbi:putative septum site-determining protein MinC [Siminovitchia terrae]|uniref:Probable septum site-determining protein MinC n=1 Tax=Siminovitchia terrae TaxID=1914933 RepID=A0A429X7I4_SIMTE|nr:septum site-determining protein MinC [Siminovitchia terrae]RST59280.1 septum site-determining protein MinC [Siminovitchia terrae]GIN90133.1 putative septum site-determining protein MinC [Siminovitchia terrae]GIN94350.1 putative septum site-determining protein MinC [Siminovitchia terrae]
MKTQNVMIKGTKSGLSLQLNDRCSYDEILSELEEKISELKSSEENQLVSVRILTGNRYLTTEQEEELKELIRQQKNLIVEVIESDVITKEDATRMVESQEVTSVAAIVRSGQVLEVPGDLLLVGDVNPGGTVRAGGNIFIMGALKGVAHAGYSGWNDAVIVASFMTPSQLRISDCISRAPDHYDQEEHHQMECAYIDKNHQIMIDRLQVLKHLRPNITRFKGGHYYG